MLVFVDVVVCVALILCCAFVVFVACGAFVAPVVCLRTCYFYLRMLVLVVFLCVCCFRCVVGLFACVVYVPFVYLVGVALRVFCRFVVLLFFVIVAVDDLRVFLRLLF